MAGIDGFNEPTDLQSPSSDVDTANPAAEKTEVVRKARFGAEESVGEPTPLSQRTFQFGVGEQKTLAVASQHMPQGTVPDPNLDSPAAARFAEKTRLQAEVEELKQNLCEKIGVMYEEDPSGAEAELKKTLKETKTMIDSLLELVKSHRLESTTAGIALASVYAEREELGRQLIEMGDTIQQLSGPDFIHNLQDFLGQTIQFAIDNMSTNLDIATGGGLHEISLVSHMPLSGFILHSAVPLIFAGFASKYLGKAADVCLSQFLQEGGLSSQERTHAAMEQIETIFAAHTEESELIEKAQFPDNPHEALLQCLRIGSKSRFKGERIGAELNPSIIKYLVAQKIFDTTFGIAMNATGHVWGPVWCVVLAFLVPISEKIDADYHNSGRVGTPESQKAFEQLQSSPFRAGVAGGVRKGVYQQFRMDQNLLKALADEPIWAVEFNFEQFLEKNKQAKQIKKELEELKELKSQKQELERGIRQLDRKGIDLLARLKGDIYRSRLKNRLDRV